MAGTVAPMDVRMAAALAGEIANKTAFCRAHGISRKTFYKWRERFARQGVAGLEERSRCPLSRPNATSQAVVQMVLAARAELVGMGVDFGADAVAAAVAARGVAAPSARTVHRILRRCGLVPPQPQKRPRSTMHRFVYARPNECWQSDWTGWQLAAGRPVAIAATLDDHSRLLVGLAAGAGPNGDADAALVWSVMSSAIGCYGVPQRSLTDNGIVYSGQRRGWVVDFEANLRALGCQPMCSTPHHPQTCGKVERFWQTLKKWLRAFEAAHGPASDLQQLNQRLDWFRDHYNQRRPHRALGRRTPAAVYAATTAARPISRPLPAPIRRLDGLVDRRGVAYLGGYQINVGARWIGQHVTALADGDHFTLFAGSRLLRTLTIDRHHVYQPAAPGRPHTYRHREPSPPTTPAPA